MLCLKQKRLNKAIASWQKADGPEVRAHEKELFHEYMNSIIVPVEGSGRIHMAPPEVQKKYAASALGKEGALRFEDGEVPEALAHCRITLLWVHVCPPTSAGFSDSTRAQALYAERGPAVLEEEKRAKDALPRRALDLRNALLNSISEEDNIKAFFDLYADPEVGEGAMFDAWSNEWPPPESIGLGWLEDIEHDIYERCGRGLPAERVFHSDPWQQRCA